MSKIESGYAASYYSDPVQQKKAKDSKESKVKSASASEVEQSKTKQTKLSDAAQKLLDKLKKTYKNMDFMVADFQSGSEAKSILSRSTKEYSVLFSPEELEKMASDEKYEKEYMGKVQTAINMSNKIGQQMGFGADPEKGELVSMGVSFNSDGTTTLFAQMEKATESQRERIDAIREKRAQEHKKAESKSVTVQASNMEDLMAELNKIDWTKVKNVQKGTGDKFDFTV